MSNYAVGYKKPPVDKRFQKGKSGNPKGRPKAISRPKALKDLMSSCLLQEIYITVGGKREKKQALEAVVLKLVAMALAGDVRASRELIELARKHIPDRLTLEDLMRGKKVAEWTPQDEETVMKWVEGSNDDP
jgi:hypothetical protein